MSKVALSYPTSCFFRSMSCYSNAIIHMLASSDDPLLSLCWHCYHNRPFELYSFHNLRRSSIHSFISMTLQLSLILTLMPPRLAFPNVYCSMCISIFVFPFGPALCLVWSLRRIKSTGFLYTLVLQLV